MKNYHFLLSSNESLRTVRRKYRQKNQTLELILGVLRSHATLISFISVLLSFVITSTVINVGEFDNSENSRN